MMGVIFIAPPAAGKGTISKYLVDNYGYMHLSTGDLLREIAKEDNSLGHEVAKLMQNGQFISDEIILDIFEKKFQEIKDKPFILDGMPRNKKQAIYLDKVLEKCDVNNYKVININISKDLLMKRATGRRLCPNCGSSYNIYFDGFKPLEENKCNNCKENLIQRKDDSLDTFNVRYQTYLEETEPLLEYYQTKNKLYQIDASKPQDEILKSVDKILKGETND